MLQVRLVATSLFDFFWRLRVRSQYKDISAFLTWNVSDIDHQEFRDAIITVTDATCLLLESLITAIGARRDYERLSDEFVGGVPSSLTDAASFLNARRAAILGQP